jgi:hypothetical protein
VALASVALGLVAGSVAQLAFLVVLLAAVLALERRVSRLR